MNDRNKKTESNSKVFGIYLAAVFSKNFQTGIYPSVSCHFRLGDDSKLMVRLDLRAEALEEDLPDLFQVKFWRRNKRQSKPKVFYLS